MANLSKLEQKILKKVSDSQLITKSELKNFLQNDGLSGRESKDVSQIVDSTAKGLIDKKLLTAISPVGSTCYIITQRGARLLSDMHD
jgi:hypothetical protein